jgi:PHD/YefM family antitoxin component YafN of YafNO toxin-antitoxin module
MFEGQRLFLFPDGTIIDADHYEIWSIREDMEDGIDNKEDLERHADKIVQVENGATVWRRGDPVA